MMKIKIYQRT